MPEHAFQRCIIPACGFTAGIGEVLDSCPRCGNLLDVAYEWDRLPLPKKLAEFEKKWARRSDPLCFSGVWRFRELLPFAEPKFCATIGEGQTLLRPGRATARYAGLREGRLFLQYEGLNPSGSFKDNGMAGAFTHARLVGARIAACASTGNTSASLAAFASALGGIRAVIFVGSGKIALGKLSQALDFGGATFQIPGDFDDAMARVREVCRERGLYLMNSVNPFRLEGQKAIIYRVLEGLGWEVPDWIVVPGGNLGNSSAFGKALGELYELGLIPRLPRLAIIVAHGANTLYRLFEQRGVAWHAGTVYDEPIDFYYRTLSAEGWRAKTVASAIEINRPVNLKKALRALEITRGLVREASDEEILDAKAIVGRDGIGCEPASAASVAGAKQLVAEGVIGADERVVCILTGHQLKAPEATIGYHSAPGDALRAKLEQEYHVQRTGFSNRPIPVGNDLQEILRALEGVLKEPVGAVEV